MKWANDVLIEGWSSQKVISQVLRHTDLGRHTSLVLFTEFAEPEVDTRSEEVTRSTSSGTRRHKQTTTTVETVVKRTPTGNTVYVWKAKIYRWSSPSVRPHGHTLPLQCSQCMGYRSFKLIDARLSIAASREADRAPLTYRCEATPVQGQQCGNTITFYPIPETSRVPVHSEDDWLVTDMVFPSR